MVNLIEIANRFAKLIIKKYLTIFLKNKADFLFFIEKNIKNKEDRDFIQAVLQTDLSSHIEIKSTISYEILLEILANIFNWKYRWTSEPFVIVNSSRNILHHAAMVGDAEIFIAIAKNLMELKLFDRQIFANDAEGKKPLHYIVESGSVKMMRFCLENFLGNWPYQLLDNSKVTLFELVINEDNVEMIKAFKTETDWNQFLARNVSGKYLLHLLIEKNAINFIKDLPTDGTNWNLIDMASDDSALHAAAVSQNLSMLQLILTQAPNLLNLRNRQKNTAAGIIISQMEALSGDPVEDIQQLNKLINIVKYLLAKGARLTFQEKRKLAKVVNSYEFIEVDENINQILKYLRAEEKYRKALLVSFLFALIFTVGGVILLATGFNDPFLWIVTVMFGLATVSIGYGIAVRFSKVLSLLEALAQLSELFKISMNLRNSYTFSQEQENTVKQGYDTFDIKNELQKPEKPQQSFADKKINPKKLPHHNATLSRDLYNFLGSLNDELEKIPGAPRLGIDQLKKKIIEIGDSWKVTEELRNILEKNIARPELSAEINSFLETKLLELKKLGESKEFVVVINDVQAHTHKNSDKNTDSNPKDEASSDSETENYLSQLRFP